VTEKPGTALVLGVSGQDGPYLARLLLDRGWRVVGTSRDPASLDRRNLDTLGLGRESLSILPLSPRDGKEVLRTLELVEPTVVYNLTGPSSVGQSFEHPAETLLDITQGTVVLLEAIRALGAPIRYYGAASSEMFGETPIPATESTPFRPRSPYGVAKAAAFWTVANHREAYGLHACSGILFNHESPLRPAPFVTRKIVQGAVDIAEGRLDHLTLGNLDVTRDWGWAPEYMEAAIRIMVHSEPEDFVIATGVGHNLRGFVASVFSHLGLDWQRHVRSDEGLRRPLDIAVSLGDPTKALRTLGWRAEVSLPDLVERLVTAETTRRAGTGKPQP
jgi:GDPmannose 4,6-dehydratase